MNIKENILIDALRRIANEASVEAIDMPRIARDALASYGLDAGLPDALRALAKDGKIACAAYEQARNHAVTTGNDRDALLRLMYGSPIRGDRNRVRELAGYIEEANK